jgi:membrane fusion protein (multidrug efflux system)
VQTSDLGNIVYIVNEKNEATIQPVVTGQWLGKEWIILSGLKAGDKVIVDNIIKLRPGAVVTPNLLRTEIPAAEHAPGSPPAEPPAQSDPKKQA